VQEESRVSLEGAFGLAGEAEKRRKAILTAKMTRISRMVYFFLIIVKPVSAI
jgi:hypothetical protein